MPNTPSQIGRGITVCSPTTTVDEDDRKHVSALLEGLGQG